MKELTVHRVNFYRPKPQEIECMAYDEYSGKLAVVRSNFSIELWDMKSKPYLDRVIPAIDDNSIESIVWCKGRLFSSSLYGQIIEYDLNRLYPKYSYHASAGAIWCLAMNESKGLLAAGTEDGIVCVFMITDEGIEFVKNIHKQEGRVVSLAWHKSGDVIIAGSINFIRIINASTGASESITVGSKIQKKETIVWCIAVTSDMTIISGDSTGKTSFWDGKTGTLLSASSVHKADVLTLCLSKDENAVYTSGVDPVTVMFVKTKTATHGPGNKWLKSAQRIVHTHDVKALVLAGEFLASGGIDTNLVFSKYPPKTVVKFSPYVQLSYCSIASEASLILLQYHSHLEMWKLGETDVTSADSGVSLPLTLSPVKTVSLQSKSEQQIICSAISSDGKWLAYSTSHALKLFHVNMDSGDPYVQKVKSLPNSFTVAAHCLAFKPSESSQLVVTTLEGTIKILECDLLSPKLLATSEAIEGFSGRKHLLAVCEDFVVSGDHNGDVTVYHSSNLKVYSHLPHYKLQPTALVFDRLSENLIVAYSDRKIVEYRLKSKAYSEWSTSDSATKEKLQNGSYYPIVGISYTTDNSILLHDEEAIYVIDRSDKNGFPSKRKKKSDGTIACDKEEKFRISNRYKHLLSFQTLREDQMVAVEITPNFIMSSLPSALQRKRFGV